MDELLQFLLQHGSFLYKECGCRFVDSRVSDSFGGDAFLILATDNVRVRLVRDRAQLFGDFQKPEASAEDEAFSIDIVRQHLTGEVDYDTFLNAKNASFVRSHFRSVERLFDQATFAETRRKLQRLKAERAKKLFG
jgi:hypothetical protein